MEYKNLALEIKASSGRTFEGYGSVFNNLDRGGDIVVPGAFAQSLEQARKSGALPQMFWMHDPASVPGVWREMAEDDNGLYVRGELLDTTLGNDVRVMLAHKAVRGLSIGYVPQDVGWDAQGNRLLKRVDLVEVSVVSLAMNPLAQVVGMKARLSVAGEYVPTERELQNHLRRIGCSKSVAEAMVERIFGVPVGGPTGRGTADDEEEAALAADVKSIADELSASAALLAVRRLTNVMR